MNFTFGIVTNGKDYAYLNNCIESIHNQKIKNYEIIIVGDLDKNKILNESKINFIDFDENIKPGWITRKKNIITKESTYENIVYMHDYLILHKKWYKGFTKFGNDYQIVMNKILNPDKSRYRDWTLWPHNDCFVDDIINDNACLIPYSVSNLSEYMYISGAYWVAKRQIMEKFPLNELSYDKLHHKKVPNIYLAIPQGKKYYVWFTHYNGEDICCLLEYNRKKN